MAVATAHQRSGPAAAVAAAVAGPSGPGSGGDVEPGIPTVQLFEWPYRTSYQPMLIVINLCVNYQSLGWLSTHRLH